MCRSTIIIVENQDTLIEQLTILTVHPEVFINALKKIAMQTGLLLLT